MALTGAIHEEFKESRASHIDKIMCKLELSQNTLIPTATEEQLLEDALRHVVHVVSTEEYTYAPTEGCNRKQRLKNILDQLRWMERKRLYDPPADNEMGHYLRIKKYINWIKAFNLRDSYEKYKSGIFGCVSLFPTLSHAQDLVELNQHLADLSEFLFEMNNENFPRITPLVSRKDGYEMKSVIYESKERNYMFYKHKFKLALVDLIKYSEFAYCPPLEDEERSYVQVFNDISSPLIEAKVGFSEELLNLYAGRIHQEFVDIERHFTKIKGWIMSSLSLTQWWEGVEDQYNAMSDDDDDDDEELAKLGKILIKKCEVSNEDLPNYISRVDHYHSIAQLVEALIYSRLIVAPSYHAYMTLHNTWKNVGWEFVHTLTLSKHGCSAGCVLQERPILDDLHKFVSSGNHHASGKRESILHGKDQYNNIIILDNIIDELRLIGDSDVLLDEEEMTLVHKIWGSVASSIHFFVGAMAYEQRRYIIQHYQTFDLSMLGQSTPKSKEHAEWRIIDAELDRLYSDPTKFARMLKAYRVGLIEKLSI